MILKSWAKINLYLDVSKKRKDGYHNLRTIFERISLFDKIILKVTKNPKVIISSSSDSIPKGKDNIVYKAAMLLKKDFRIKKGADIVIEKNIPVGAGLGGGSSNAAYTLIGLNRLWGLGLTRKKILSYARCLGSDVAFFVYETPFAFAKGRGERIKPLYNLNKKLWHILVVPQLKVSTKEIYAEFDKLGHSRIKKAALTEKQLLKLVKVSTAGILHNNLERVTFKNYPIVERVKGDLNEHGLKNALMSGSGGAVFALTNSRKEGLRLAERLKRTARCKVFVVSTR